jgi:hypothetical protein
MIILGPHIYGRQRVHGHLKAHIEFLAGRDILYSKFGSRPAQIGEINGVSGDKPDSIMS